MVRRRLSDCPSRTRPTKGVRCSTRRRSSAAAASSRGSGRRCCRPTTSSTKIATSSRSTARRSSRSTAGALGISICEDIWNDRDFWKRRRYHHDPVEELVGAGADVIVNLSASPFSVGKHQQTRGDAGRHGAQARRAARVRQPVRRQRRPGVRRPELRLRPARRPDRARSIVRPRTWWCSTSTRCSPIAPPADLVPESEIWRALVLGTRDYARKCGFERAVLGLSGGIDSALTAAIAAEALGPRPRARRADAVAVLEPRQHRRFAAARGEPRHRHADAADRPRSWRR